ncbi:hypothetical protein E2C01_023092 [Portunus trituberculatus]|uniref:Uncharacterized protein n=1 Tax=Portunus trituberculatus TaxID=210409 RepID=A0A5B7E747_PORTR|nr:hypothetical protein [Portunus trituberculatus]
MNLESEEMAESLKDWGVMARISSSQYPQSAAKTAKRIIKANTSGGGTLDTDKASLPLVHYLNTPVQTINKSPTQLAAVRQLRDGDPTTSWHLKVNRHWGGALHRREVQMGEAGDTLMANSTPRQLSPLAPNTHIEGPEPGLQCSSAGFTKGTDRGALDSRVSNNFNPAPATPQEAGEAGWLNDYV